MAKPNGAMLVATMALCTLSACGGGSGGSGAAASAVVTVPSTSSSESTSSTKTSPATSGSSTQTATATSALAELPPLDLADMALWNWDGIWHASEWDNEFGPIPWKYDRVQPRSDGSVDFVLDADGSAQLQAVNGTPARSDGLWEAEVTLPQMRDGVVVAPLWIYNSDTRDEVDFEFAGRKGLDVSMHTYVNGQHKSKTVRLFAGQDFSGRTMRFGIDVDTAGGVVEMLVDGEIAYVFDQADTGWFVSDPMRPFIQLFPMDPNNTGFVQWVGEWQGMAPGDEMRMTVHGYGYSE